MSPELDYASGSLIAYLGNKRALLPFLREVFLDLDGRRPIRRFLDPFAGSGAVSRLARVLGWKVLANDIEPYSWAVNSCWLCASGDDLPRLFAGEGGLGKVLESLNRLHPEREDALTVPVEPYIARHYAPADTAAADWRRERLFYTRENAVFLDRVRQAIEELRPRPDADPPHCGPRDLEEVERAVLLGPLVYEAATHANTSGVFKAFHKGFGGHGRDALGRILAQMRLAEPLLWTGIPAELGRTDAADFCRGRGADLCYLDPPYNQHQYGSNYHLLNTLVTWNRPPVDERRTIEGTLVSKAGIPPEWKERRSAFCSAGTAAGAFRDLLGAVDARYVVLSYNSEGLVAPEELYDMLAQHAEVRLRSVRYSTYRGGRQSEMRRSGNSEILFVAERRSHRSAARQCEEDRRHELRRLHAQTRLGRVLAGPFDPALLRDKADDHGRIAVSAESGPFTLGSYRGLLLDEDATRRCSGLQVHEMEELATRLEGALLPDNGAACEHCTELIETGARDVRIQRLALLWLRKLAHRKYAARFELLHRRLKRAAAVDPVELTRLETGLRELELLFAARMAGASPAGTRA